MSRRLQCDHGCSTLKHVTEHYRRVRFLTSLFEKMTQPHDIGFSQ